MNDESTAVVTAAAGLIGRAVVERLLAEKVVRHVIAVDIAGPTPALPGAATPYQCDLRDRAQLASFVERMPDRLSVLVNVLGGERRPPVLPVDDVAWPPDDVWEDIIDLNLSSAYRLTRALRDRLGPGSAICNISSIAAAMPWAVSPAYGASKAALEHWSSSLAVILADRGVRVNLVRPGFVWSPQWHAIDRAEFDRVVRDRVPLQQVQTNAQADVPTGREQTADDVAAAVAFLSSPAAAHITGQAINVDGGATLVRAAR